MADRKERITDVVLACGALALAAHAALTATMLGDYPNDAAPAMNALLSGDFSAFAHAHPAMGDLSLLVRLPFSSLAYIGHPTQLSIYRWGALPCVGSVALLGVWLGRIARSHGSGPVAQLLIVVLCVLNPLTSSAINLGHPEELLTASLCIGALIAAGGQRSLLTMLLLGLALACKQWSVVIVLPVLLVLERRRLATLGGSISLALVLTLPEMIGAPGAFINNQLTLAHKRDHATSALSWWWPLFGSQAVHAGLGAGALSASHRLPALLVGRLHELIVGLDIALATLLGWVRKLPLRRDDAFALTAIVLLLRCTLDAETMPYYYAGLLLTLFAWDATRGERLPWRGLIGVALAYLLFDRMAPTVVGVWPASLLYGAVTLSGLLMLATTLIRHEFSGSSADGCAAGVSSGAWWHPRGQATTLSDPSALPKTAGSA